jgi:hypothetical protein
MSGVWSIPKDNDSNSSRYKGKTELFYGKKPALNLIYASGIMMCKKIFSENAYI